MLRQVRLVRLDLGALLALQDVLYTFQAEDSEAAMAVSGSVNAKGATREQEVIGRMNFPTQFGTNALLFIHDLIVT